MNRESPETPRHHRVFTLMSFSLILVYLVYLAAANLVLNAGLMSVILPKPEKMLVEINSGWSLIPGVLHLEGFRIRGQTKTLQWQGQLQQVRVTMSVLGLVSRKVSIRSAIGSGLQFRMRPRLSNEDLDSSAAEFFPDIEGLSNPPDPAPESLYPPKQNRRRFGWRIEIDDMQFTGPTDIWIARARMSGTGSVAGSFEMIVRGNLELPEVRFQLENGELRFDEQLLAHQLDIETDLELGPFSPREVKGTEVFDHLLGSFQLANGEIPDLAIANPLLPAASSLELAAGTASFGLNFEKTSTEEGSTGTIELEAERADLRLAGRQVLGDIRLTSTLVRGSLTEGSWQVADTNLRLENVKIAEDLGESHEDEVRAFEDWWGEFEIETGAVRFGQPSELEMRMQFVLRNSKPLLALLLGREGDDGLEFPAWIKLIPNLTDVRGVGTVAIAADGTRIDDVVIIADQFALLTRLTAIESRIDALAYLEYKALDVGIGIRDGRRKLKLIAPRKWFVEQLGIDRTERIEIPLWLLQDRGPSEQPHRRPTRSSDEPSASELVLPKTNSEHRRSNEA